MASCTSCGTQSPDVARFCMGCGARLPDAQPVAPPLAATGPRQERKVVTVLFADLAGFTTRSEGADPEDVRALVRPFHAVLRREVDSFGGTLARIVGDAGLAVFGYPAAHEDDAERAVRAGLAILAGLERLNADTPGLDLHARVGVNTGEAVVTYGDPAEDADDLMGEAVNAAQRLQATAPVDGLVIGEATHAAAGSRFGLAALDDVAAKGLTAPLRRWRVLGPAVEIGAAPPQPSPFVGREDALALLERELHAVRDGRTVRLVTVLGEPGIGKGRLIAEFERRHAAEAAWRHGDTPAYGEALAFRALADIVRAEVGIRDSDTRGQAQRRLLSRLAGLVAEPLERRWLASHVAALLRLGPAPSGGREEAFAAWGRFLERIAGDASVLVLGEPALGR
ncbi:MAG: adenylate/guanylate cyclase domain-containing protein [Chloroflexota bacterium]